MMQHLIVYRINTHQVNMAAFVSDFSKEGTHYSENGSVLKGCLQEELFQAYEDFENEAQELFKVCSYVLIFDWDL
jgi:hypothetical protein